MEQPEVRLEMVAGPEPGRRYSFTQHDTFLFGRSGSCHVTIPTDTYISQYHFLIETNPPLIRIRDCGSLNGTLVNGLLLGGRVNRPADQDVTRAASAEMELKDGDRIQAGQTVFRVSVMRQSTTEAAPQPPGGAAGTMEMPCSAGDFEAPDHERYEIERTLGRGGMGIVYLARDRRDGTRVALKTVIPDASITRHRAGLLRRETETLRALGSRWIVRLIDTFCDEKEVILVMEYCSLGNAAELAERYNYLLPQPVALAVIAHTLNGLVYAHRKGFVHRDIKPANILLDGNRKHWRARLGDFGLAKSFDTAGLSGMTATGSFAGTFDFTPREQLTNYKYVRPASDVWSIAATFYWLLTGRNPRLVAPSGDPVETVLRNEIVPLAEYGTALSPDVVRVIDTALRPLPEDRYPSAVEFRDALRAACAGTTGDVAD